MSHRKKAWVVGDFVLWFKANLNIAKLGTTDGHASELRVRLSVLLRSEILLVFHISRFLAIQT